MKSSNVILAVAGVALLVIASQIAKGQPAADSVPKSILSKLEVGMQVRILGEAGRFSIETVDGDRKVAGQTEVTEIGHDYFVVKRDSKEYDVDQAIPLHAIASITRLKSKPE
jgi:hypothetical protein